MSPAMPAKAQARLAAAGIQAQVQIEPGSGEAAPKVTLFTNQPQEALELAKELLGETGYSWETAEPKT